MVREAAVTATVESASVSRGDPRLVGTRTRSKSSQKRPTSSPSRFVPHRWPPVGCSARTGRDIPSLVARTRSFRSERSGTQDQSPKLRSMPSVSARGGSQLQSEGEAFCRAGRRACGSSRSVSARSACHASPSVTARRSRSLRFSALSRVISSCALASRACREASVDRSATGRGASLTGVVPRC